MKETTDSAWSDWNTLPHLALVNIFAHLNLSDRFRAALVCKSWSVAFNAPQVWRFHRLQFDGLVDLKCHVTFAEKQGRHVKCLQLVCPRPQNYTTLRYSKNISQSLGALKYAGCQLKMFVLKGLYFKKCWSDGIAKNRIAKSLKRFLNGQKELSVLNLEEAELDISDAVTILQALAYRCKGTVVVLNLRNYITGPPMEPGDIRLCEVLQLFSRLQRLEMSYRDVSSALVSAIAASYCRDFKTFRICVEEEEPRDHVIAMDSWSLLRTRCPELGVELIVDFIPFYEDIQPFLQTKMPLRMFHLITGEPERSKQEEDDRLADGIEQQMLKQHPELSEEGVYDAIEKYLHLFEECMELENEGEPNEEGQDVEGQVDEGQVDEEQEPRKWKLRSTLKEVMSKYSDTLEDLQLDMYRNKEKVDDILLKIMQSCPKMASLRFNGRLAKPQTVRLLCLLTIRRESKMRRLHVRSQYYEDGWHSEINRLSKMFRKAMRRIKVDFRLTNWGPTQPPRICRVPLAKRTTWKGDPACKDWDMLDMLGEEEEEEVEEDDVEKEEEEVEEEEEEVKEEEEEVKEEEEEVKKNEEYVAEEKDDVEEEEDS